jgi:hypothetical protein
MSVAVPSGVDFRVWSAPDPTLTPVETTWNFTTLGGSFTGSPQSITDVNASSAAEYYCITVP